MPNNTSNKLKFMCFSDESKLKEIENYLKSENSILDFNNVLPLNDQEPREIWGTKWNAYSIHKLQPETWSLVYFFETAWSYPMPIIRCIFDKFPDVYISFDSACEGGWFALSMNRDDEGGKIETIEYTTQLGNDPKGEIRKAIHSSLDL